MSNRDRLKQQLADAAEDLDRAFLHFKNAEEWSEGRSQVLNETLPSLVLMVQAVRENILSVREML